MKYTITLYDAEEILPEESGNYLALVSTGYWAELSYSKKHKLFNVFDRDESLHTAIDVDYWTVIPKIERKVK